MRKYLLSFFLLCSIVLLGQPYSNSTCSTAMQIVTGQNYSYPAWTGYNLAPVGPAYACLTTQPDPAWFFCMIGTAGDIHINIYSLPCKDIDFCLWGPYTSLDAGCNGGLTTSKVVSCSYFGYCTETANIANCNAGEFYIMMITNYSTQACTIYFSQTSGTGGMSYFPAPTINNNGPFCEGQNLMLTTNPVVGADYHWTGPNGFTSTLQNPVITNITVAQAGTYTCSLGAGTSLGPVSTTQVVVNPIPQPVFVLSSTICFGTSVAIGGAAQNGMTYSWTSNPAGFTSSLANPIVAPVSNTQYTLNILQYGCSAHVVLSVNVLPLPVAVAGIDTAICEGNSISLGSTGTASYNYTWSSIPAGFTSTNSNPGVNPLVNTTYTLLQTILATGCSNTATVAVTVNALPIAYTGPGQTICNGNTISLGTFPNIGFQYFWTSNPPGFTSSIANPMVSPTVNTIYNLTVLNSSTSCYKTNSVNINVFTKPKILGVLKYDNTLSSGLDSCRVDLIDLPNLILDSAITTTSGNYNFKCLDPGYYKLDPHCKKKWGGVNVTDAMLIAQYSVGIVPLSSLRTEAADVNQSHYVNALDAYMVMRRFVGQINSFPSGDWLLPTPDSSLVISLTNTFNITGVCYGDVNGSYIPPGSTLAPAPLKQRAEGKIPNPIPLDQSIRINEPMIPPHAK